MVYKFLQPIPSNLIGNFMLIFNSRPMLWIEFENEKKNRRIDEQACFMQLQLVNQGGHSTIICLTFWNRHTTHKSVGVSQSTKYYTIRIVVTKPKRNIIYINRLLNSSGYFSHSFMISVQVNSLLSDGNEYTHYTYIKELKPPSPLALNFVRYNTFIFLCDVIYMCDIFICCTHFQCCYLQKIKYILLCCVLESKLIYFVNVVFSVYTVQVWSIECLFKNGVSMNHGPWFIYKFIQSINWYDINTDSCLPKTKFLYRVFSL